MKICDLIVELEKKECFKIFSEKYAGSFLCAGFFILDIKNKKESYQLDFFMPVEQKIASFEYPFETFKIYEDKIERCEKLEVGVSLDVDGLSENVEMLKQENNVKMDIVKIIAILREGMWNLTCLDGFMGMLRIKINSLTGEVEDFQKGSIMDVAQIKKKGDVA